MANLKQAADQVKQALDRIQQAKSNPQQLEQAIADARQKVDALCKQSEED